LFDANERVGETLGKSGAAVLTQILRKEVQAVGGQTKRGLTITANLLSARGDLMEVTSLRFVAFRTNKAYLQIHGALPFNVGYFGTF
jgi:hypothetical protein